MIEKANVIYRIPNGSIKGLTGVTTRWDAYSEGNGFLIASGGVDVFPFLLSGKEIEPKEFVIFNRVCEDEELVSYVELVSKAVNNIKSGAFEKVVLSAFNYKQLTNNLITVFHQLGEAYPQCMIVLWSGEKSGTWIGASPELLLRGDEHHWETSSLAGTALVNDQWGEKESEEQAFVTRHIEACCHEFSIPFTRLESPIEMGNVRHLQTKFELFPQKIRVYTFLQKLHPTPAVVGFPRNQAWRFIEQEEGHKRDLYTGYWGVWEGCKNFELFVNIRCARVGDERVKVYGGAGITNASDPMSEMNEIQRKIALLASYI